VSRHPFRDVAIVGAANTRQARSLAGHTSLTIAFAAAQQVMTEAGIAAGEVDGVFGDRSGELVRHLGIGPVWEARAIGGISNLLMAASLIASTDSRRDTPSPRAGISRAAVRISRLATCGDGRRAPRSRCRGSPMMTSTSGVLIERPQSPHFTVRYACGIVELEEGYRMLATVAGCAAEDLADGLPLVVDFQLTDSGQWLPFFRPAAR
jgi:hypothetical protein